MDLLRAAANLTAGEIELLGDATTDDVSMSWVLIDLGIRGNPPPFPGWRPTDADLDLAFASLARLRERGLIEVGRIERGPGRPTVHVAEPLEDVRRRVGDLVARDDPDDDWEHTAWVVPAEGADIERVLALADFQRCRDAAEDLVECVDSMLARPWQQQVRWLHDTLADLVVVAARLPEVEPSDADGSVDIEHAEWRDVYVGVGRALAAIGVNADYWTTTDPTGSEEPAVVNLSLADDVADIWRDLAGGLRAVEAGYDPIDVLWDWRFTFHAHWGKHAVEALRVLRDLLTAGGLPGPRAPRND